MAPPAVPPAAAPAPGPQPLPELGEPPPFGAPPAGDELDPFSAAPLVPSPRSTPRVIAASAHPAVEAVEYRRPDAIVAPNAHREDGPPALPASLQRVSQLMPGQPTVAAAPIALPPLKQPSSVAPSAPPRAVQSQVAQVNYQAPSNVQLVNPAAVITDQTGAPQLEQAIYYEASDQSEEILRY